jgi:DNA-binding CsgD family transcriptional regulator
MRRRFLPCGARRYDLDSTPRAAIMTQTDILAAFSDAVAELLPLVGESGFPQGLIALLRRVVPVDDATVLVYPAQGLPLIEYSEVPSETGAATLDRFIQGMFLLDPYYAAGVDGRRGLFRLGELAPDGFRDSEYYRHWYRYCGYRDECGYLVALADGGFANIALGRTGVRGRFARGHIDRLAAIRGTVESLTRAHWAGNASQAVGEELRERLRLALAGFGSSLLTERESQVINRVLHGHGTKTIADRLGISVETVKLHRKHAYAKLEINSQAELFYLFLDSLISAGDYAGGDTLEAYLRRPDIS